MNFLKLLFGNKIENENKTKPFYKNKTRAERIDWFSRTRPWNKVDSKIIYALVDKFGDDPMFEVFMFASKDLNLVARYEDFPIPTKELEIGDNKLICIIIAAMLCKGGHDCAKLIPPLLQNFQNNIKRLEQLNCLALDAFMTAIILDKGQISAYLGIAIVHSIFNKKELALKAALQGLDQINQDKASGSDVVFKQHRPDLWASDQEIELKLKLLVEKLS